MSVGQEENSLVSAIVLVKQEKQPTEIRISSDNLFQYLGGLLSERGVRLTFDKTLSLPYLTYGLQELFNTTKLGSVWTDEEFEQFNQQQYTLNPTSHPIAQEAHQRLINHANSMASTQAAVERTRSLYWDLSDNQVKFSAITQHKYREGLTDAIEIYDQGHIPLIPIHTHPTNSLPSQQDYTLLLERLLIGESQDVRFIKALIVVGPDIQILALATSLTPLLEEGELDKKRAANKPSDQQIKRFKQLVGRVEKITEWQMQHLVKSHHKATKGIVSMDQAYAKGLLTEAETKRLMEEETEKALQSVESYNIRAEGVAKKAQAAASGYEKHLLNSVTMQFARDMGIKLYFSTNFQDFTEFSS